MLITFNHFVNKLTCLNGALHFVMRMKCGNAMLLKVLILVSLSFNFYYFLSNRESFTFDQCLRICEAYRNDVKMRCDNFVSSTVNIRTTSLETPTQELNLVQNNRESYPVSWNTSLLDNDGYIRNCITEEAIGKVEENLKSVKYVYLPGSAVESSVNRIESFKTVFQKRAWGHRWDENYTDLSASGRGSTLQWSQEFVAVLHISINHVKRLQKHNSKIRILDVPCGDMAWMSRFLNTRNDIDYTGMDIVPELIKHHKETYKKEGWKFILQDIVTLDSLGGYDIILCRMLLQHLYSSDAKRVLKIFSNSPSGLLIMTTFPSYSTNKELKFNDDENPGRYREVNLEIPPYSLTPPLCLSKDGSPNTIEDSNIFVGVWKLPLRKMRKCRDLYSFHVKSFDRTFYSCYKWS